MLAKTTRRTTVRKNLARKIIVIGASVRSSVNAALKGARPEVLVTFLDDIPLKAGLSASDVVLALEGHPGQKLAAELDAGYLPEDALTRWTSAAQARLVAYRRLRRHLLLVSEVALVNGDATVLAAISERLSVTFDLADPEQPKENKGDGLVALVGSSLIEVSQEAKSLRDELAAMQIGGMDEGTTTLAEFNDAWASMRALRLRAEQASLVDRMQIQLASQSHETAMLRSSFLELQSESGRHEAELVAALSASAASVQQLELERNHLRECLTSLLTEAEEHLATIEMRDLECAKLKQEAAAMAVLRAESAALRNQLDARSETSSARESILCEQILKLEREAENTDLHVSNLEMRCSELFNSVQTSQQDVRQLLSSTSWRLTSPLRTISRILRKTFS